MKSSKTVTNVRICVFTSIHREAFICLEQLECQGTKSNEIVLKTLLFLPSPYIAT